MATPETDKAGNFTNPALPVAPQAGVKYALKQVYRDPVTRKAFVFFVDSNTGTVLTTLDGYTLAEGGTLAGAPEPAAPAPAPTAPTAEEGPMTTEEWEKLDRNIGRGEDRMGLFGSMQNRDQYSRTQGALNDLQNNSGNQQTVTSEQYPSGAGRITAQGPGPVTEGVYDVNKPSTVAAIASQPGGVTGHGPGGSEERQVNPNFVGAGFTRGVSPQGVSTEGMAGYQRSYGPARPNDPNERVMNEVRESVYSYFGPGYEVVAISGQGQYGSQDPTVGHRDFNALDFDVVGPEGKVVDDRILGLHEHMIQRNPNASIGYSDIPLGTPTAPGKPAPYMGPGRSHYSPDGGKRWGAGIDPRTGKTVYSNVYMDPTHRARIDAARAKPFTPEQKVAEISKWSAVASTGTPATSYDVRNPSFMPTEQRQAEIEAMYPEWTGSLGRTTTSPTTGFVSQPTARGMMSDEARSFAPAPAPVTPTPEFTSRPNSTGMMSDEARSFAPTSSRQAAFNPASLSPGLISAPTFGAPVAPTVSAPSVEAPTVPGTVPTGYATVADVYNGLRDRISDRYTNLAPQQVDQAAAALAGNFVHETGAHMKEGLLSLDNTHSDYKNSKTNIGIASWQGSRAAALQSKPGWNTLSTQLDFVMSEDIAGLHKGVIERAALAPNYKSASEVIRSDYEVSNMGSVERAQWTQSILTGNIGAIGKFAAVSNPLEGAIASTAPAAPAPTTPQAEFNAEPNYGFAAAGPNLGTTAPASTASAIDGFYDRPLSPLGSTIPGFTPGTMASTMDDAKRSADLMAADSTRFDGTPQTRQLSGPIGTQTLDGAVASTVQPTEETSFAPQSGMRTSYSNPNDSRIGKVYADPNKTAAQNLEAAMADVPAGTNPNAVNEAIEFQVDMASDDPNETRGIVTVTGSKSANAPGFAAVTRTASNLFDNVFMNPVGSAIGLLASPTTAIGSAIANAKELQQLRDEQPEVEGSTFDPEAKEWSAYDVMFGDVKNQISGFAPDLVTDAQRMEDQPYYSDMVQKALATNYNNPAIPQAYRDTYVQQLATGMNKDYLDGVNRATEFQQFSSTPLPQVQPSTSLTPGQAVEEYADMYPTLGYDIPSRYQSFVPSKSMESMDDAKAFADLVSTKGKSGFNEEPGVYKGLTELVSGFMDIAKDWGRERTLGVLDAIQSGLGINSDNRPWGSQYDWGQGYSPSTRGAAPSYDTPSERNSFGPGFVSNPNNVGVMSDEARDFRGERGVDGRWSTDNTAPSYDFAAEGPNLNSGVGYNFAADSAGRTYDRSKDSSFSTPSPSPSVGRTSTPTPSSVPATPSYDFAAEGPNLGGVGSGAGRGTSPGGPIAPQSSVIGYGTPDGKSLAAAYAFGSSTYDNSVSLNSEAAAEAAAKAAAEVAAQAEIERETARATARSPVGTSRTAQAVASTIANAARASTGSSGTNSGSSRDRGFASGLSYGDARQYSKETGKSMTITDRGNGTFGWSPDGGDLSPGARDAGWLSNNPERSYGGYGSGYDPTPS